MPYPENLLIAMREDLTKYGLEEARTPADVDRILAQPGTTLMVTNSVCGCAAGRARPAIGMALQHSVKPDHTATVFAGGDELAVAHLREILKELVAGHNVKQIALRFGTSPNTVRNQRGSIVEKMEANSMTDLVRMVLEAE